MLVRRLLLLLSGYAIAVGLVLTAIMLVPALMEGLNTRSDGLWTWLRGVFTPPARALAYPAANGADADRPDRHFAPQSPR